MALTGHIFRLSIYKFGIKMRIRFQILKGAFYDSPLKKILIPDAISCLCDIQVSIFGFEEDSQRASQELIFSGITSSDTCGGL